MNHVHVWMQGASQPPQVDDDGREFIPSTISCRCGVTCKADTYTGRVIKAKSNRKKEA